jgi:hypothetical protein
VGAASVGMGCCFSALLNPTYRQKDDVTKMYLFTTILFTNLHEKIYQKTSVMGGHSMRHLLFLPAGRPTFVVTPGHHPLWGNQS